MDKVEIIAMITNRIVALKTKSYPFGQYVDGKPDAQFQKDLIKASCLVDLLSDILNEPTEHTVERIGEIVANMG